MRKIGNEAKIISLNCFVIGIVSCMTISVSMCGRQHPLCQTCRYRSLE